ncbi:MAG TPA: DUF4380 domain-containing protein, partial [Terriglobia bacterium]|nr:DUF4380 domain-containing protein [Terriglobia bacterium]
LLAALFSILSLPTISAAASQSFPAKIGQAEYLGWKVYRLSNGLVNLYIAPQLGGRAIQLELGDEHFFFVNKSLAGKVLPENENNLKTGWANYGGDKVWPAPEGWDNDDQWPSIPYYVLDGSTWDAEVMTNNSTEVALRVTSPKDPRSGVQFVRTFHVYAGTTRVKVEELMRNISRRRIRWGIWHLIQNDAADARDPSKPNPELYMYVPLNPRSMFPSGYYNPYGDARHPSYQVLDAGRMLRIHYLYRVGKIAADSDAGWYAVENGQKNICLVETFKYFPGEKYPDNASVESWNDGPGIISRGPFDQTLADDPAKTPYFLESEVLSPFATLDPGEEYEFTVQWSPTRAPNPIHDAVWAAAISEPFSASINGNQAILRGVFGVFLPGTLQATFYSSLGEELSHENLMAVDPRDVVRLEKSVAVPAGAYRVSLRLLNASGENLGFLGNVILR